MANSNLGILARVNAGKTTLTERIHVTGGIIAAVGRAVPSCLNSPTNYPIDPPKHAAFVAAVVGVRSKTRRPARAARVAAPPLLLDDIKIDQIDQRGAHVAPRSVPCNPFGH